MNIIILFIFQPSLNTPLLKRINKFIFVIDSVYYEKKPNGKWELSVGDISRFYKSYRLTVWVSAAKDVANF